MRPASFLLRARNKSGYCTLLSCEHAVATQDLALMMAKVLISAKAEAQRSSTHGRKLRHCV